MITLEYIQSLGEENDIEVDLQTALSIYYSIPIGILHNKQWVKNWILSRIGKNLQ